MTNLVKIRNQSFLLQFPEIHAFYKNGVFSFHDEYSYLFSQNHPNSKDILMNICPKKLKGRKSATTPT